MDMPDVDPQLVEELREQHERRDAVLRRGAQQVSWNLGVGGREKIEEHSTIDLINESARP